LDITEEFPEVFFLINLCLVTSSHCSLLYSKEGIRIINEKHIQVFDWPEIICEVHDSWGLLPYYKKLIPFLCRIGLVSNNKFKIKSKEDSEEFFKNLFDINYWHNI